MAAKVLKADSFTQTDPGSATKATLPDGPDKSQLSLAASSFEDRKVRPRLDRCWGKAGLACAATFFTSASHSNSGFFFVAFMRLFDANRETAAWPTSIFQAADESAGFIGLGLQKFFAVSTVCLMGSVLFWAGILLSLFAPNVTWMSVTFGAMQGAGSGIVCFAVTLLVMMYFDRYRGVAIGIRYAGYSLSSLIYPAILARLEEYFPFKQVLLLFAAISLHLTPLVLALKEPKWTSQSRSREKHSTRGTPKNGSQGFTNGYCLRTRGIMDHQNQAIALAVKDVKAISSVDENDNTETIELPTFDYSAGKKDGKMYGEELNGLKVKRPKRSLSTESKKAETNNAVVDITALKTASSADSFSSGRLEEKMQKEASVKLSWNVKSIENRSDRSVGGGRGLNMVTCTALDSGTPGEALSWKLPINVTRPATMDYLDKVDIFSKADVQTPSGLVEEASVPPDAVRNRVSNIVNDDPGDGYSSLALVQSPVFWLFVIGGVLADYADSAILSTIVDSALDRGATRVQADMAIICSAPSQLVGRTVLPLIADLGFMNRTTMTCASYFLFAASVATLALTQAFSTYAAAAVAVSIFTGSIMTMKHVVAADYFGVDAVAATWVACGALTTPLFLCSPSILGFFRDRLGCYDQFYYCLASVHALVGVLFLFLLCHTRRREKSWNLKQ